MKLQYVQGKLKTRRIRPQQLMNLMGGRELDELDFSLHDDWRYKPKRLQLKRWRMVKHGVS